MKRHENAPPLVLTPPAVMDCRKVLMNTAVHQGAEEGKTFAYYVDFLDSKGYIPPNGRAWERFVNILRLNRLGGPVTSPQAIGQSIPYWCPCKLSEPIPTPRKQCFGIQPNLGDRI